MQKENCRRCGYAWAPRIDPKEIRCCPKCKSRFWRQTKKNNSEQSRTAG